MKTYGKGYDIGYKKELIELLLTTGIIPYQSIHMLERNYRIYVRTIRKLESDKIVETVRWKKKKIVRLKRYEENYEEYITNYEPGYYGYYNKCAKLNARNITSEEESKCIRSYREGQIELLMYGASIPMLAKDKLKLEDGNELVTNGKVYLNSVEIKRWNGPEKNNSRAHGLVISEGGEYIIYHTGKRQLKWAMQQEGAFAQLSTKVSDQIQPQRRKKGMIEEAVVFTENQDVQEKIIYRDGFRNETFISTNVGYRHLYLLPLDQTGKKLMREMTEKGWKEKKKEELLPPGTDMNVSRLNIDCDGISEDGKYYLVYCIPDAIKLTRFVSAASFSGKRENYIIYCYAWQKALIEKISQETVVIRTIEEREK